MSTNVEKAMVTVVLKRVDEKVNAEYMEDEKQPMVVAIKNMGVETMCSLPPSPIRKK